MTAPHFAGDFDLLPLAASLHFAHVPEWPTESDFHLAVSDYCHAEERCTIDGAITVEMAAARWRIEAIRHRRAHGNGGKPLDLPAIAQRTAAALYQHVTENQ